VLNVEGVSKLQTMMRLTQRMEDLIESLLHFSRLGRVELDAEDQPERISEKCYRRIKQPERHQGRYPHSSALTCNSMRPNSD